MRIARRWEATLAALLLLTFALPLAAQQSQQKPSLGEAARQLREPKKEAPPAKHVWTEDDLAKLPAHARVNVMGPPAEEPAPAAKPQPTAAPESAAAPPAATTPAPTAPETAAADQEQKEKERGDTEAELQDWKDRLTSAKKDLDLLQREHDLARQQFYSNPQYQLDTDGQRHLDDLTSRADATREEIDRIQVKIVELQDKLKELNQELGPKKQSLTEEQERDLWAGREQALEEQLAQVDAQLNGMRKEAAAREMSLYAATQTGSPTSNLLQQLELRRLALLGQLDELAEQARHAGVPAAWVR